jgi:methionyl-tRNA formyltransferase
MNAEFDGGASIAQVIVQNCRDITPQKLFEKLALASAPLLIKVLNDIILNKETQIESRQPVARYMNYYSRWKWDSSVLNINTKQSFLRIYSQILSATQESYEYPGPKLQLNGKDFIIRKAQTSNRVIKDEDLETEGDFAILVGEFLRWERKGEDKALIITQLQPLFPCYFLRRASTPAKWFHQDQHVRLSRA